MTNNTFIESVAAKMKGPLPGREAQFRMASISRMTSISNLVVPDDVKVACVMHLLHFSDQAWRTVLIKRTVNPHDRHSGQISFPGGRYEPTDGSLEQVALRETEEEIGVPADQIQLLGPLTDLYIPVSNFLVHPFVGFLKSSLEFTPQPGEVAAILTPPISLFSDPDHIKQKDIIIGTGVSLPDVPYFDVEGHVVWGATAMILSEFLTLIQN